MSASIKPGRRVLIYGLDPVLLDTRRMILEHAGLLVEVAHNGQDFESRATEKRFDLLIVCHTVPAAEEQRAVQVKQTPCQVLRVSVLLPPETFLFQVQQLVA